MKRIISVMLALVLCLGLGASVLAAGPTFADVPVSHWAYQQVERAFADGAVNGSFYDPVTGVRRFSPDDTLTLAQFTAILTRAFYGAEVEASTAAGSWYAQNEAVARAHDLFNGVIFGSLEEVASRYNMAVLLSNVLWDKGVERPDAVRRSAAAAKIADRNEIPVEYWDAVCDVYCLGIICGIDAAGTFAGRNSMSRAQAAVVYSRVADTIANSAAKPEEFSASLQMKHVTEDIYQLVLTVTGSENYMTQWMNPDPAVVIPVSLWSEKDAYGFRGGEPGSVLVECNVTDFDTGESRTASYRVIVGGHEGVDAQAQMDQDDMCLQMLELVNRARGEEGLAPLVLDDDMVDAAQQRAQELLVSYSHTRPNGSSYYSVLSEAGLPYSPGGENIAAGYNTVEEVFSGWMNSDGHRKNILKEGIGTCGFGYAWKSGDLYGHYWVQIFGP